MAQENKHRQGFCNLRRVSAMAADSLTATLDLEAVEPQDQAPVEPAVCGSCGQAFEHAARQRKNAECARCGATRKMVARHLGTWPDSFDDAARADFFRRVAARSGPAGSRLSWETVRAEVKEVAVRQAIHEEKVEYGGSFLPLSVWVQQGWEKSVVLAGRKEKNEELGIDTYQLRTKYQSESDVMRTVNEQLLQKEAEVRRKRGRAGAPADDGGEWDVPLEAPVAKQAKTADKSAARAAARQERADAREERSRQKFREKELLAAQNTSRRVLALAARSSSLQRRPQ